jgi:putative DNA primase/helicase
MTPTTNGANPERNAPSTDLARQPIEDQRRADAGRYVDIVFGEATGYACGATGRNPYLSEKGKYTFPDRGWNEFAFRWPEQRDELVESIVGAADAKVDLFLCPYLRTDNNRKKGSAVDRRLVHADIDVPMPVEKVKAVGGFAIDSGTPGHGHAYIALSVPVSTPQHEALCRAWARYLVGKADPKISDNDVLRPPGSVNRKSMLRGEAPSPVRWLVKP